MTDKQMLLEKIIDNSVISEYEISTLYTQARTLIHLNSYKAVIYGAGVFSIFLARFFKQENIDLLYFIDADKSKRGKFIEGIEIISPDDLKSKILNPKQIFAFIVTDYFDMLDGSKIMFCLMNCGINKYLPLRAFEKSYLPILGGLASGYDYYVNNKQDVLESMETYYYDEESKQTIIDFVRMVMECDTFKGKMHPQKEKYFGSAMDPIYVRKDDEVWINAGAQWGDNIYIYIDNGFKFDKIFPIEGNEQSYKVLLNNIEFLPKYMQEKIIPTCGFVGDGFNLVNLSDRFMNENISLINMDIEGAERKALRQAKELIVRKRPVLAVCAYHKYDDFVELPKLIASFVSGYRFYLRKYVTFRADIDRGTELVLYAVPEERAIRTDGK